MAQTMSILRRSNSDPPALQTKLDVNPTLIVSWWATIFSLVVILIRVIGRWVRTERLFREDKVVLWSIVPLMLRMAFIHPVLIWGTNNTDTFALSEEDIHNRSLGSRLVLGSRIWYAIYIWVAKTAVLEFVQKIIGQSWTKFYQRGTRIIYTFLGLTLLGVIVATLAECQPFSHYWQVVPDPGASCRTGRAQLITMGACDIVTDVVLMAFPIPLVIMSKMRFTKKVSLVVLFLLSVVLIAITAYRIPGTMDRNFSQQFRSLLASLEILAATCISNMIVIGSFLRDKGVKKVKYRAGSFSIEEDGEGSVLSRPATHTNKPSVAQRHWGSDEDLVRDLGLTLSSDLRHDSFVPQSARLAPVAEPADTPYHDIPSPAPIIAPQGRGLLDPAWNFRKGSKVPQRRNSNASSDSESSVDFKMRNLEPYTDEPVSPSAPPETPYKKMNFFDVGGLVDMPQSESSSMDHSSRRLSQVKSAMPTTRSSQNFLADVGGLLSPISANQAQRDLSPMHTATARDSLSRHGDNVRERSKSPLHHMRVPQSGSTGQRHSSNPIPHIVEDPDDLNISDAGGLLK